MKFARVYFEDVRLGDELPPLVKGPIQQIQLTRYAGASGDFNPIHYRDDVATGVGLPGVIAHGMLTMGLAVQPVVDWAGDPARVSDYQVRFTRPVVVDAEARTARVDLTVTFDGRTVLGKAQVRVVLA